MAFTWTILARKKGSQVTKNMPSRIPRVRLAFRAFRLCLVARRLLSMPGYEILGTYRKENCMNLQRKTYRHPTPTLVPPNPSPRVNLSSNQRIESRFHKT